MEDKIGLIKKRKFSFSNIVKEWVPIIPAYTLNGGENQGHVKRQESGYQKPTH